MKLYAFAISALAIGALVSCSNDIKDPADNTPVENLTMNIARTPDFVAWSGSNSFGDTRANTRADGDEENSVQESHKPMNPEVEVNLAINSLHQDTNADEAGKGGANYTDEDLVSKLSIHIRCATDVTVTIPVGPTYYCDQDDLYIFNRHDVEHLAYGPFSSLTEDQKTHVLTYEFDEYEVSLKLTFGEENITVETKGMNQDVIDYCYNNFHDGLNFEVYNYFIGPRKPEVENSYTTGQLQRELNKTLVEFKNVNSLQRYINAFGKIDYTVNGLNPNCTVKPDPLSNFDDPYQGPANNGSDENWIYKNKTFNNQSTESEE